MGHKNKQIFHSFKCEIFLWPIDTHDRYRQKNWRNLNDHAFNGVRILKLFEILDDPPITRPVQLHGHIVFSSKFQ